MERQGSISTLFVDFDRRIEPLRQRAYDHVMLVNVNDPLCELPSGYMQQSGDQLRLKCLGGPTSVENRAFQRFSEIAEMGCDLETLEVQETDTSTLVYSREDWLSDPERLGRSAGCVATESAVPRIDHATESVVGLLLA